MIIKRILKKFFKLMGYCITKDNGDRYENQIQKILDLCKINLVFDIGANTGEFAKKIRSTGYTGRIISFEPLSSARAELIKLAKNDENLIVYDQVALGNKFGEIKINISKNLYSSSVLPMLKAHLQAAPDSAYIGSENVKLIKLDSIANKFINSNSNLFIKIDTQGYEHEVLKGGLKTIENASVILSELSLVPLYSGQKLFEEMINKLEAAGFVIWALQNEFDDLTTGRTLQMNGIFIKKKIINSLNISTL